MSELACYDMVGTPGIAADLSHIPTACSVTGSVPTPNTMSWPPTPSKGNEGLAAALSGADVVVIPAGVPRKPGMTRDDLFNTNASIVKTLVEACAKYCPKAVLCIISNPVNSTVPIAAEVLKKAGVFDPKKLCGVTTLDVCRANTFLGAALKVDPKTLNVPVIGGHAGITILPLLSQIPGAGKLTAEQINALTVRIQFGGDEVVAAKAGSGSATLSMAYAALVFTEGVLKGLRGDKDVIMPAFVKSNLVEGCEFFASPVRFGKNGVEEVLGYGTLSPYEKGWFDKMVPDLKGQITKGQNFVLKPPAPAA